MQLLKDMKSNDKLGKSSASSGSLFSLFRKKGKPVQSNAGSALECSAALTSSSPAINTQKASSTIRERAVANHAFKSTGGLFVDPDSVTHVRSDLPSDQALGGRVAKEEKTYGFDQTRATLLSKSTPLGERAAGSGLVSGNLAKVIDGRKQNADEGNLEQAAKSIPSLYAGMTSEQLKSASTIFGHEGTTCTPEEGSSVAAPVSTVSAGILGSKLFRKLKNSKILGGGSASHPKVGEPKSGTISANASQILDNPVITAKSSSSLPNGLYHEVAATGAANSGAVATSSQSFSFAKSSSLESPNGPALPDGSRSKSIKMPPIFNVPYAGSSSTVGAPSASKLVPSTLRTEKSDQSFFDAASSMFASSEASPSNFLDLSDTGSGVLILPKSHQPNQSSTLYETPASSLEHRALQSSGGKSYISHRDSKTSVMQQAMAGSASNAGPVSGTGIPASSSVRAEYLAALHRNTLSQCLSAAPVAPGSCSKTSTTLTAASLTPVFRHPLYRGNSSSVNVAFSFGTAGTSAAKKSPLSVLVTGDGASGKPSTTSIYGTLTNQTAINSLAASPAADAGRLLESVNTDDSALELRKKKEAADVDNLLSKLQTAVYKAEVRQSSLIASPSASFVASPLSKLPHSSSPLQAKASQLVSPSSKLSMLLSGQSGMLPSAGPNRSTDTSFSQFNPATAPPAFADSFASTSPTNFSTALLQFPNKAPSASSMNAWLHSQNQHLSTSYSASKAADAGLQSTFEGLYKAKGCGTAAPYGGIWEIAAEQDTASLERNDPKHLLLRRELFRVLYDKPSCPLIISQEFASLVSDDFF